MASSKVNLTIPKPEIEVYLYGEWTKAIHLTDNMKYSLDKARTTATLKYGRLLLKTVRNSILTGRPPKGSGVRWPALSDSTIKNYGKHSIYNLKGTYLRSIGIHTYKSRTLVGIPIRSKPSNPKSRLTLNQVAIILEHGSKDGKIPPRPLWKPSIQSVERIKPLKKLLIKEIRSQLLKDFNIYAKQVR